MANLKLVRETVDEGSIEHGGIVDSFTEYLYGQGLSERTIVVYVRCVERWIAHSVMESIDAADPSAMDLAMYAQVLPLTATSRRQHRVALRHWFESIGVQAPVAAIRVPPKKRYLSRALEPNEATALVNAASDWFPEGIAVLLGMYLGLRREEIARARWDRFDQDFEWYTVRGKGDVEATLPVHQVLANELAGRVTAFPWIFPGRSSAHVCPGTIGTWVGRVAKAAGITGMAPHRMRHTAVATINDATGDLRAAQEFARHASPETTRIYTRVTVQRLRRAVDTLDYVA